MEEEEKRTAVSGLDFIYLLRMISVDIKGKRKSLKTVSAFFS